MPALTDTYLLPTDVSIPKIGFGTWQIPNGAPAFEAVTAALDAGYRHIDTALAYDNEEAVGRAIAASGLRRDEVFVTTKLPAEIKTYDGAVKAFETSLSRLGLDAVDLYLIHAPWPWDDMGQDYSAGNAEVWRAIEAFYEAAQARAIGVSNFSVKDLTTLAETARIAPQVNQIRYFIGHTQRELVEHCNNQAILVEAYSPLATGAVLNDREIKAIAQKYGKTAAQICIRYALQKGVLPLPKTTRADRMAENAAVDFEIEPVDMQFLDALTDTAG